MFIVHVQANDEEFEFCFDSLEEALGDPGLRAPFDDPQFRVTASVWIHDLRITPDISTWEEFKKQLIKNSSTILRERENG